MDEDEQKMNGFVSFYINFSNATTVHSATPCVDGKSRIYLDNLLLYYIHITKYRIIPLHNAIYAVTVFHVPFSDATKRDWRISISIYICIYKYIILNYSLEGFSRADDTDNDGNK